MKPNREILKNTDAKAQLFSPTKDNNKVDPIPKRPNDTKKNILLFFRSAMRPKIGAKTISRRLADELAAPRIRVLVVSRKLLA